MYRLLWTTSVIWLGVWKTREALASGGTVTATWLELVTGVILTVIYYWIGLYEAIRPPVFCWFFHHDYVADIGYLTLAIILCTLVVELFFILIMPAIAGWIWCIGKLVRFSFTSSTLGTWVLVAVVLLSMIPMVIAVGLTLFGFRAVVWQLDALLKRLTYTRYPRRLMRRPIKYLIQHYFARIDNVGSYIIFTNAPILLAFALTIWFPLWMWTFHWMELHL